MKDQSLEGLKGIACLIVAYNHFYNLFGKDEEISLTITKIFNPFINGSYMVYIFIGLSFYFVALKIYKSSEMNYGIFAINKYLRLVLPIFFLCLTIFFLNKIGIFNSLSKALELSGGGDNAINYESANKVRNVLWVPFAKCLFTAVTDFAFPIWMIHYIFLGAFITIIISLVLKDMNLWLSMIVAAGVWFCMIFYVNTFYSLAPIFAFIAYISYNFGFMSLNKNHLGRMIFLIGFSVNYISFIPIHFSILQKEIILNLGAACIVGGVLCDSEIRKILSMHPIAFLGEISFEIYLVHQPITTSIMAYLYIAQYSLSSRVRSIIMIIEYLVLIIVTGLIWKYSIRKFCIQIQNLIITLLKKYMIFF